MIYRIVYWITDKHLQFTIALIYMKDFQYILTRKYALQQLVSIWMKKKNNKLSQQFRQKSRCSYVVNEWWCALIDVMQIMPPSYSSTNLYWIQIDVCTDNIDGTHTHTRRASASTYGRHWCFHALFLCRSQWNTKFCYRNLLLIRSLDQYSYSTHKTHQTITIIIPIQWISYNSGEFSVLIKSLLGWPSMGPQNTIAIQIRYLPV